MLNLLDTDSRIQDLGSLDAELSKNKQKAGLAIKLVKRGKSAETVVKRNAQEIGYCKRKLVKKSAKAPVKKWGKNCKNLKPCLN
jgi:hypothetical protein